MKTLQEAVNEISDDPTIQRGHSPMARLITVDPELAEQIQATIREETKWSIKQVSSHAGSVYLTVKKPLKSGN